MKDELDKIIMTKCVGLSAKTYSYLIDEGGKDKKEKDPKKFVMKRKLKFEDCKTVQKQPNLKIKKTIQETIKLTQTVHRQY